MKILTIEKFFSPSSELTKKITDRMREQSLADLQRSIGSVSKLETDNSPSTPPQNPWIALLAAENQINSTSAEELEEDQRWLSEILYGYLARLAYSCLKNENQTYDAAEAISAGMTSRLGIKESTDLELLQQLGKEFQQWLSECSGMTFVSGWGKVWADPVNKSRFGVELFSTVVEDEVQSQQPIIARSARAGSDVLVSKSRSARGGQRALSTRGNWLSSAFSRKK